MLALASGPIYGRRRKRTLVVGVVGRAGVVEGVLPGRVTIDGDDSASALIRMFRKSRFKEQIRAIVVNGIAMAGLNVIDVKAVEDKAHVPLMVLTRIRPNVSDFMKALDNYGSTGNPVHERKSLVERMNKERGFTKISGFYVQSGMKAAELKGIVPAAFELLRLAHLIARGISTGISKGRV